VIGLVAAAFVAGAAGSLHCVGMCGPFAVAGGGAWFGGRALAYLAAGAVAGSVGRSLPTPWWAGVIAAGILAFSCLRFAGVGTSERAGGGIAQGITRLGLRGVALRFGLGVAAALLPCGLLWAGLGIATAARTTVGGSLVMSSFFIGTTPTLLATRSVLAKLPGVRRPLALAVFVAGLAAIGHRVQMAATPDEGPACGVPEAAP
jgi:sulfite exporter TauE/SafE